MYALYKMTEAKTEPNGAKQNRIQAMLCQQQVPLPTLFQAVQITLI